MTESARLEHLSISYFALFVRTSQSTVVRVVGRSQFPIKVLSIRCDIDFDDDNDK